MQYKINRLFVLVFVLSLFTESYARAEKVHFRDIGGLYSAVVTIDQKASDGSGFLEIFAVMPEPEADQSLDDIIIPGQFSKKNQVVLVEGKTWSVYSKQIPLKGLSAKEGRKTHMIVSETEDLVLVSLPRQNAIFVYQLRGKGQILPSVAPKPTILASGQTPYGQIFAVAGTDGITFIELDGPDNNGALPFRTYRAKNDFPKNITGLAFTADSKRLLVGSVSSNGSEINGFVTSDSLTNLFEITTNVPGQADIDKVRNQCFFTPYLPHEFKVTKDLLVMLEGSKKVSLLKVPFDLDAAGIIYQDVRDRKPTKIAIQALELSKNGKQIYVIANNKLLVVGTDHLSDINLTPRIHFPEGEKPNGIGVSSDGMLLVTEEGKNHLRFFPPDFENNASIDMTSNYITLSGKPIALIAY